MLKLSAAETAVATGTDVKTVHNVVDDLLPHAAGPARTLSAADAVVVAASTRLGSYLTREAKKLLAREIKRRPRCRVVRYSGGLTLDIGEIRSAVHDGVRTIQRLRQLAVSDPDILGGDPVFRGTRIPVALIAHMVESGESVERIKEGYPPLTERQIRLAPLYMKTYPRRGRPPVRPWAGKRLCHVMRVPMRAAHDRKP